MGSSAWSAVLCDLGFVTLVTLDFYVVEVETNLVTRFWEKGLADCFLCLGFKSVASAVESTSLLALLAWMTAAGFMSFFRTFIRVDSICFYWIRWLDCKDERNDWLIGLTEACGVKSWCKRPLFWTTEINLSKLTRWLSWLLVWPLILSPVEEGLSGLADYLYAERLRSKLVASLFVVELDRAFWLTSLVWKGGFTVPSYEPVSSSWSKSRSIDDGFLSFCSDGRLSEETRACLGCLPFWLVVTTRGYCATIEG